MNMKSVVSVLGLSVFLTGCPLEDDDVSQIRITHASSDAPPVAVLLNGETVGGLENVDYQTGSQLLNVESGTYNVGVEALLPGDERLSVISANLDFSPDMQYDIVAVNQAESIEPVVLSRPDILPSGNEIRVDVLHAHPDVPAVDIYLNTEEDISAVEPAVAGLAFKEDHPELPVIFPAATYRLRLTLAGSKTVAYDSGPVELNGGSDLLITAVPNVSGGAVSPVNLLVADGEQTTVLRNLGEQVEVRVVHAVADAPNVDVLASGSVVDGLSDIAFREFRSVRLAPEHYDLSVAAAFDNSVVVIDAPDTSFAAGTSTSIYAVGKLNSVTDSTIEPLIIPEELRPVAAYAKVRVVHASSTAAGLGRVDIHASVDGVFDASTVVLEGVDFKQTAVLNVPAGTYQLAVILQSDPSYTPAVTASAEVENGGVYSVVATDDFAGGLLLNVDNTL
ncbi:DUF4397 domain-containing protein [Photobacterium ganghwense]|uniref:DUF4397 domain-containing protein n=1 Tax=Photobacterium ganghwense TaxID=320778 RepID=UPI001C2D939E|nr:DUF4397 domain-containing protein [Photobacterium ganghwense]MBV1839566.1 DUF4397 domain-containing protein [Photobacterium ganghwense]